MYENIGAIKALQEPGETPWVAPYQEILQYLIKLGSN